MAKKTVNKSAAIREYMEKHGEAKNVEIIKALGKKGVTVNAGNITPVRKSLSAPATARKTSKKAKTTRKRKAAKAVPAVIAAKIVVHDSGLNMFDLSAELIKSAGSVDEARKALSAAKAVFDVFSKTK